MSSKMFPVGMLGSYITQGVITVVAPFHPFGGAVDIIVVEQEDGTFKSSPWYVQFGKFQGVFKATERTEKIVGISVNDVPVDFHMYLDHKGEAYFEKEARPHEDTIQSPPSAPSSGDEMAEDGGIRLLTYSKTETGEGLEILEAKDPVAGVEASTSYDSESLISGSMDRGKIVKANSDSAVWISDELVDQARNISISELDGHLVEADHVTVDGSNEIHSRETNRLEGLPKAGTAPSSSLYVSTFEQAILYRSEDPLSPALHGDTASEDSASDVSLDMSAEAADHTRWNTDKEESVVSSASEVLPLPNAACRGPSESWLQERETLARCLESGASSLQLDSHAEDVGHTASLVDDMLVPTHLDGDSRELPTNGFSSQPSRLSSGDVESRGHNGFDHLRSFRGSSNVGFDDEYLEDDLFKSCLALEELQNHSENDPGRSELEVCDSEFEVLHTGNISLPCDTADPPENEQLPGNRDGRFVRIRSESIAVPYAVNKQRINLTSSASLPSRFGGDSRTGHEQFYSHSVGSSPVSNTPHAQSDSSAIAEEDLNGNVRLIDSQVTEPVFYQSQKDNEEFAGDSDAGPNVSVDVDLSLCRHLLLEGIGADAAAAAFDSHKVFLEEFERSGSAIMENDKLVVKIGKKYFSWAEAAPYILGMAVFGNKFANNLKGEIAVEEAAITKVAGSQPGTLVPSATRWNLWPFSFRRSRVEGSPLAASTVSTTALAASTVSTTALAAAAEVAVKSTLTDEFQLKNGYYKQPPRKSKERTYVPTSAQLASLNLKKGPNKITFTFTTRFLGKTQVDARIHLWKSNTRIVISDVDGTITRSDVLGQVMPLVGKDWSQSGVTRLFSAIKDNGYELLFLSARAISQAYLTRQFLLNLKQDGETLPDGPMFISPDGLIPSLYREVIRRAPHEFKISCLEGIRELFPRDVNPFYAGFGNRDTDEISYLKVGIPKGKVFIINPKGEVVVNHRVDVKSYTSLHMLVDDMFPPMSLCEQEDFNSWNFWKLPIPDIDDDSMADSSRKSADTKG